MLEQTAARVRSESTLAAGAGELADSEWRGPRTEAQASAWPRSGLQVVSRHVPKHTYLAQEIP